MSSLENLVQKVQGGDSQAFLELVQKTEGTFYRFAQKMCSSQEDAQDAVQETFLTLHQKIHQFRGDSSFLSWSYAIVRSHCQKQRKKNKKSDDLSENIADHKNLILSSSQNELEREIEKAIDHLDPKYREIFVLRDVEGMSTEEVSQITGLTISNVKSRLHRARESVREDLSLVFGDSPQAKTSYESKPVKLVKLYSMYLENDLEKSFCDYMKERMQDCPECAKSCKELDSILSSCKKSKEKCMMAPEDLHKKILNIILK